MSDTLDNYKNLSTLGFIDRASEITMANVAELLHGVESQAVSPACIKGLVFMTDDIGLQALENLHHEEENPEDNSPALAGEEVLSLLGVVLIHEPGEAGGDDKVVRYPLEIRCRNTV